MSKYDNLVDLEAGKTDDGFADIKELGNEDVQAAQEAAKDDSQEASIPNKFKDKSLEDVISSYVELEKASGRQANELGELRKLTDSILTQQLKTPTDIKESKRDKVEPVSFDDLVEDPESAVSRIVDSRVKAVEDKFAERDRQDAQKAFESKHPDFIQTVNSEEFIEWVQKSPYRVQQFQAADQWDYNAADALFDSWAERQELVKVQKQEHEQSKAAQREQSLKDASSESGSTGATSRKIFRRIDLMQLRQTDPERYDAMYPEIAKAYAEGRVK